MWWRVQRIHSYTGRWRSRGGEGGESLVALPAETLELLAHGVLGLDLQHLGVLEMLVVGLLLLESLNGTELLQEVPDLLLLDGEDAADDKRLGGGRGGESGRRWGGRRGDWRVVFVLLVGSLASVLLGRLAFGAGGVGDVGGGGGRRHAGDKGAAAADPLLVQVG